MISRYELKAVIDERQRDALIGDLSQFTIADPLAPDGCYSVTSRYYDSPDFDSFRLHKRLRLRVYGPGRTEQAFVEIKSSYYRLIEKQRIALRFHQAEILCGGRRPRVELEPEDQQVVGEVLCLVKHSKWRPSAIVRYQRQAFVGGLGERVTFDTEIEAMADRAEFVALMPPHSVLLELKAAVIPLWAAGLLAKHQVRVRRLSKYRAALAYMHAGLQLICPDWDHESRIPTIGSTSWPHSSNS